jgi:hypothetical protein
VRRLHVLRGFEELGDGFCHISGLKVRQHAFLVCAKNPTEDFYQLQNIRLQSPSENRTVRYSNGHFPNTICVLFSNGKIGHLVFNVPKTGPVFRPHYIGKAN